MFFYKKQSANKGPGRSENRTDLADTLTNYNEPGRPLERPD